MERDPEVRRAQSAAARERQIQRDLEAQLERIPPRFLASRRLRRALEEKLRESEARERAIIELLRERSGGQ
jgi:hypothetical protein